MRPGTRLDDAPEGAFGEAAEDRALLGELARIGPPEAGSRSDAVPPLGPAEAMVRLAELEVEPADARDVVDALPRDESSPWWWCVERTSRLITGEMGSPHPPDRARPVFEGAHLPVERRCFLAHVFLAVLERTRAWHRAIGIPEDVARASFADLRRHLAIHRRRFGVAGVDGGWWVTLPLRGVLFDLGRLQFERSRLGSGYAARWEARWPVEREEFPLREDEWCLAVHIPEGGPLVPAAVEASFGAAAAFFSLHFPAEFARKDPIVATCTSWMLDPQLRAYLPEDSNVIGFQRRFSLIDGGPVDDRGIVQFVFRRSLDELDVLPQGTTLERAVVTHLRDGGHWHVTSGWCEIPRRA
jgi:hypothetical protein